jgi:hypothetical protein
MIKEHIYSRMCSSLIVSFCQYIRTLYIVHISNVKLISLPDTMTAVPPLNS